MILDHLWNPLIFLAMYPLPRLKSSFLHPDDNNCFSNVSLPFTSETMQKSAILSNQSVIKLQLSFQRYGYDRFIGKRLYCRGERILFFGPNTNTNIIRNQNFDRIRIRIVFVFSEWANTNTNTNIIWVQNCARIWIRIICYSNNIQILKQSIFRPLNEFFFKL